MTQATVLKGMTDPLERFTTQIKGMGCDAIAGLEKIASELEMKELANQLKLVNDRFRSDVFKLIVVGRFKTGKSTLINAMLGKPETQVPNAGLEGGPMPVDDLPATAVLTRITYASTPFVRAWDFDGKPYEWSFAKYHQDAVLRASEKDNQEFFKNIREFEVGYPAKLCKYALLFDSPGTDESPARTAITTEALRQCDAVIVVYRHEPFAGERERQWVAENILDSGVRVFTVVNLWVKDGRARNVDDRLRSLVWNKLVQEMLGGEGYRGQDFTSQDIYFVSAKQAGEARLSNNAQLYEESGMALFEERLTDFLLKEKNETHLTRFVRAAEQHADKMVEQIAQRRSALAADRQKLQRAAEVMEKKLDAIRARRDKLPKILDRYRRECVRELSISFDQMIGQLRQELPSLVRTMPLRSLEGVSGAIVAHFTKKVIANEAAEICMNIIKHRIDEWCKNPPKKPGAQQILEPIIQRMVDEVADEVVSIQTSFRDLHFDLTGYTPAIPRDPKNDIAGRIIGIVGGILFQDVGLMVGGAGGLRGFAGTLGGYIVGTLLVSLMGLSLPVAIPAVMLAGLLGGVGSTRIGLENRIWTQICEGADLELSKMPANARAGIEKEILKTFTKIEEAIMRDAGSIIEQEEENLRSVLVLNQQDQESKNRSLQVLNRAETQIGERRKQLKNVLVMVKQISGQERAEV